jgi:VIT1/CCC1 family predicted Fe2+/Mn2+ transporter
MDPANSWSEEKQSAWLYRALAEAERDTRIAALFRALADAAEAQAATWEQAAAAAGQALPSPFQASGRARLVAALARRLGPRRVKPALAALKVRGLSAYTAALGGHLLPTDLAQVGLSHRTVGGGNLRAAIFGVNDGLVSNASLILGVVGAQASTGTVLATGIAGLLAGALSMAAGEYVSVRSQRELFEYQIGLEADELKQYPEAEAEELALIYIARGMDQAQVPLVPFFAGSALPVAAYWGTGFAAVGLFGTGAAMSLFSGRNPLMGGLRMLGIGALAGATVFLIGHLIGVDVA